MSEKLAVLTLVQDYAGDIYRKCHLINSKYISSPSFIFASASPPITDFAAYRNQCQNEVLQQMPDVEWFLWIDSDEVFPWQVEIMCHKIVFTGQHNGWQTPIGNLQCIFFPRYNLFFDEEHYRIDAGCHPDNQNRLIRKDLKWTGKVHEYVQYKGLFIISPCHIYHYGWLKNPKWQEEKHARFHRLAGKEPTWKFPQLSEVTLKKLPEKKVIQL